MKRPKLTYRRTEEALGKGASLRNARIEQMESVRNLIKAYDGKVYITGYHTAPVYVNRLRCKTYMDWGSTDARLIDELESQILSLLTLLK